VALSKLAEGPFDAIVTEMRMPGMDGAELLARVRDSHPGTMRIVLSGDAERDAMVRAVSTAHQYLSKPCHPEVLTSAIERVTVLAPHLTNPALRDVIGAVDRLPSLPSSFAALGRVVASPTASLSDVARVVATDSAMAIKILQVANSAYFGVVQRKATLEAAISFLGLDLVKALALTTHVFSALGDSPVEGFSLERFQRGAIVAARLARSMVRDPALAEEAFAAALVHDIGQVVLALGMPERYAEALWLARDGGVPLHVAEQDTLDVAHPAVGAFLLGVWGLPLSIVDLTAHHHSPSVSASASPHVLPAVRVATALAGEALQGDTATYSGPLDTTQLEFLKPGVDLES